MSFWKNIDKSGPNGCWVWMLSKNSATGYGRTTFNGERWLVHRLAWYFTHGRISRSLDLLHDCPGGPNTMCVNPQHMRLGSHKENMQDRSRHGKTFAANGEASHHAKLRECEVKFIRRMRELGVTRGMLANIFKVRPGTIQFIDERKTWKHI